MGMSQPSHSTMSFPALWRASSSSPWCQRMKKVATSMCLMFPSFHKHHALPCKPHVSPASHGNLFMQTEYVWALLLIGINSYGDLKLCRTVSNVKPCYADHVNELNPSFSCRKWCCVKPPAEQPKQGHGLLLKGSIFLTIPSPTCGGSCGTDRTNEQTCRCKERDRKRTKRWKGRKTGVLQLGK